MSLKEQQMTVTWIGNHEEGVQAFRETAERGLVNGFITLSDEAFEKRSAGSRAYAGICEKFGIPYYTVDTIKGKAAYEIISKCQPDLLVVFGWSEILPERLLEIPTVGTVGTHAALLPHNRGSAPVNWALIHGETVTGNTMMWLSKDVDAGAIVDQISFPITLFDTCKTLYDEVAKTNAVMLSRLIDALERGERPVLPIENRTDEPILPRRRPKDGLLNWHQSANAVYDFIRALTMPYPGAFSFLNGHRYLLWKASVLPLKTTAAPGTILGTGVGFEMNGTGLCVAAEDGIIYVTMIEDENGRRYADRELYELGLEGVFENE
ncbi:MAG: methionyl-tRNA formyltransferase [Clostridia bacterium]|nr:methionyl-tRNA formyltransferase [Clostridia bacterium]